MFGFDAVMSTMLYVVLVVSFSLLGLSLDRLFRPSTPADVKRKAAEHLLYVFVGFVFIFCFYVLTLFPEHH